MNCRFSCMTEFLIYHKIEKVKSFFQYIWPVAKLKNDTYMCSSLLKDIRFILAKVK